MGRILVIGCILLVGAAQFCERVLHTKLYQKLGPHPRRLQQTFFYFSGFSIMVVILCTWAFFITQPLHLSHTHNLKIHKYTKKKECSMKRLLDDCTDCFLSSIKSAIHLGKMLKTFIFV